jgi:hypothetical protein
MPASSSSWTRLEVSQVSAQETAKNDIVPKGGFMSRVKLLIAGLLIAGALGGSAPTALGATPTPTPGSPGCVGQIVATINHLSGAAGASGNPRASAGPGYFLGPDTPAAIAAVRAAFC